MAADFARPFGAEEWAYIAGLRHDEGKATNRFQNYLREVFKAQNDDSLTAPHVDHSTAGAQQAVKKYSLPGYLLAYAIAGHHGGLPNGISAYRSLHKRLRKTTENSEHICNELPEPKQPELPNFIKQALGDKNPFTLSFFVRMLFSTLTDADFLDTERFLNPERADGRIHWDEDTLEYFEKALDFYAERLPESKSIVSIERKRVRDACINAAEKEAGLFSLTVPTGGGKTLSSLAFALKHARLHGMRRIIYVIPFTTIVEQTADVFRNVLSTFDKNLAESAIIEHHSNFEPDHETLQSRLATENWDAPLIITTSVQFYESLFSNRSSQCRKLHNLSKSVIILDEAQTLPVDFLEPCLKSLTELTYNYNCSAVLCTATQPAVKKRDNFPIGLENVKEIITDRAKLYDNLKRVNIKNVGELSDVELARRLVAEEQALCIVNTRKHAAELYAMIKEENGVYHLSALMCPAHRQEVLGQIFKSLKENELCRVVSTQLIEAGIDIDFPVVFRSMAGVDAVAQAAGRCNRHGQNPKGGETIVFTSEHQSAERFLQKLPIAAGRLWSCMKIHWRLKQSTTIFASIIGTILSDGMQSQYSRVTSWIKTTPIFPSFLTLLKQRINFASSTTNISR